jgi:hypothetical protein
LFHNSFLTSGSLSLSVALSFRTQSKQPPPKKRNTPTDFLNGFFLNCHGLARQTDRQTGLTTHERDPHLSLPTKLNYPSVPYHSYSDPIMIYIYVQ